MPGSQLIIGVDFDGTIVEHDYPKIGRAAPGAIETLQECQELGARLILWTMRSGKTLAAAVKYLRGHGIRLFGVNRNPEQATWSRSPKAYCHVYVDDAAMGCPLVWPDEHGCPVVDWHIVRVGLLEMIRAKAREAKAVTP